MTTLLAMPEAVEKGSKGVGKKTPQKSKYQLAKRIFEKMPKEVDYMNHESFALPETEDQLFGPDAEPIDVPLWAPSKDPEKGMKLAKKTLLTPQQEVTLFLRYNYARYRLNLLVTTNKRRTSFKMATEMEKWYSRAARMRINLVRANIALVYAMSKRTRVIGVEIADLVSEGSMALLRSVEKFDVSRGAKFSTYACRSILKSFGHIAMRLQRKSNRLPITLSPDLDYRFEEQRHEKRWRESLETLREIIKENQARLNKVEQIIVNERFALKKGGKLRTLAEVAKMVGLTDERVRQIQIVALGKIKVVMEKNMPYPARTAASA